MSEEVTGAEARLTLLTLATLGKGAAIELFDHELAKVLDNIADPNTDATSKRSIKLVVTIIPSEARDAATVRVDPSCKLAPYKGDSTLVYIGRKGGRMVATTYDMRQTQLDWDAAAKPRALPGASSVESNHNTGTEG